MDSRYYATCFWPGLPELWWRGRMSGLPAAIAFAVAINLLLLTRFIYPQWIAGGLVSMAFWTGILVWSFCVVRAIRELPLLIAPRTISEEPDHFPEARAAYLQGNWAQAEALLTSVLAIEPRDPPALLLLIGVYRHTERLEAAEVLLQEVAKLEVTDTWLIELDAEAGRLQRAIETSQQASEPSEENQEKTADAADLTETKRRAA